MLSQLSHCLQWVSRNNLCRYWPALHWDEDRFCLFGRKYWLARLGPKQNRAEGDEGHRTFLVMMSLRVTSLQAMKSCLANLVSLNPETSGCNSTICCWRCGWFEEYCCCCYCNCCCCCCCNCCCCWRADGEGLEFATPVRHLLKIEALLWLKYEAVTLRDARLEVGVTQIRRKIDLDARPRWDRLQMTLDMTQDRRTRQWETRSKNLFDKIERCKCFNLNFLNVMLWFLAL